ncbi:unnamed protein product [Urochloa humidicola]
MRATMGSRSRRRPQDPAGGGRTGSSARRGRDGRPLMRTKLVPRRGGIERAAVVPARFLTAPPAAATAPPGRGRSKLGPPSARVRRWRAAKENEQGITTTRSPASAGASPPSGRSRPGPPPARARRRKAAEENEQVSKTMRSPAAPTLELEGALHPWRVGEEDRRQRGVAAGMGWRAGGGSKGGRGRRVRAGVAARRRGRRQRRERRGRRSRGRLGRDRVGAVRRIRRGEEEKKKKGKVYGGQLLKVPREVEVGTNVSAKLLHCGHEARSLERRWTNKT